MEDQGNRDFSGSHKGNIETLKTKYVGKLPEKRIEEVYILAVRSLETTAKILDYIPLFALTEADKMLGREANGNPRQLDSGMENIVTSS